MMNNLKGSHFILGKD